MEKNHDKKLKIAIRRLLSAALEFAAEEKCDRVQRQIRAHRELGSIDRWREIPPEEDPAA